LPILLVLVIVLPGVAFHPPASWDDLANMLPFLLMVALLFSLPLISARWALAKQPYLAEEMTYSFDAQGVRLAAASFSATAKWPIVRAIRETKSAFLLYEAPYAARIVPKHFFRSERELVAWKGAVTAWIAPKSIHAPGLVGKLC
jgi:hypothetical protein